MGFQPAASPVMEQIENFHIELLYIIIAVCLFVLALLVWIVVQVPRRRQSDAVQGASQHAAGSGLDPHPGDHPGGDRGARPSGCSISKRRSPSPMCTIKAIGKQWFWTYEYPGANAGFTYRHSLGLSDADAAKAGEPRLLGVDNTVVVPVNKVVESRDHRRRRDPFLGDARRWA